MESQMAFNWTCPHCNHAQTVTAGKSAYVCDYIGTHSKHENLGYSVHAVACSNPGCEDVEVKVKIGKRVISDPRRSHIDAPIVDFRAWPESSAKPQPDYIPEQIRDDYVEACRIRDLSPKASATLSRRCMQGMIRDFCGVDERTLYLQITALERLNDEGNAPKGVFDETIAALHNVRRVGNIGAHMESDINLIVDVEPKEAGILLELIETLFDEWYIARYQREQRFSKLNEIAAGKQAARKSKTEDKPEDHS